MSKIKPLTGKVGDFSGIVLKAAARGDAKSVRHYLKINPSWLNQEGPHGRTLLWEAAYKSRTDLVAELIGLGADVNVIGSYYTPLLVELSPLALSMKSGNAELEAMLRKAGARDDLHSACYRGDLVAINAFLSADPEAVNRPARDTEPHPRMGYHPVHYAVVGAHIGALRLLAGEGANVAEHMALLRDWAGGKREILKFLKGHASKGNSKGKTRRNAKGASKQDRSRVPAIDRPDWMGFPPLVDACRGNHNAPDDPARVKKLLDRGANVNVIDHKKKTPLHRAGQAGFIKITKLLLKNDAELEAVDEKGGTPLFDAAHHGRTDTAKLLLKSGANLDHTDGRGETALFAAARGNHQETFEFLLAAGCDPGHKNTKGKTVADVIGVPRHSTPARVAMLKKIRSVGK